MRGIFLERVAKELGMRTYDTGRVRQAEPFERPTEGYNDAALGRMPFRIKFALIKNSGDKVSARELASIRKDIRGSSKNALFAANHLDDIFFEDFFAAIIQGIKRERGRQVPDITNDIRRHRIETRVMVSQGTVFLNDGEKAAEGIRKKQEFWRLIISKHAQKWSYEQYFEEVQGPPSEEEYYTLTEFRKILKIKGISPESRIESMTHILKPLAEYVDNTSSFLTCRVGNQQRYFFEKKLEPFLDKNDFKKSIWSILGLDALVDRMKLFGGEGSREEEQKFWRLLAKEHSDFFRENIAYYLDHKYQSTYYSPCLRNMFDEMGYAPDKERVRVVLKKYGIPSEGIVSLFPDHIEEFQPPPGWGTFST